MMRRFSRDKDHRKALFLNLSRNLITHKKILTTLPKAKDLAIYIAKILTRCKIDTLHNRRILLSKFGIDNKEIVNILYTEISPAIQKRNGGYTRIVKTSNRKGDGAPMAYIELVDLAVSTSEPKIKKTQEKSEEVIHTVAKDTDTILED